ncbi:hypothetical protein GQX74_009487 [Glossina fuscipes]|nr:hypothetical protein GQX74_009487 [Glossina fuscipes]
MLCYTVTWKFIDCVECSKYEESQSGTQKVLPALGPIFDTHKGLIILSVSTYFYWISNSDDKYLYKFLHQHQPFTTSFAKEMVTQVAISEERMSTVENRPCLRSTLAITVALASMTTVDAEECGQEEFAKCAEPLEMLHLTSEFSIGAAKKEELDKLCHELRKGVRCIQSYTRRCMDMQQRHQFNKLYHGTHQFIGDLCNKGEFQDVVLYIVYCGIELDMHCDSNIKHDKDTVLPAPLDAYK